MTDFSFLGELSLRGIILLLSYNEERRCGLGE